MSPGNLCIGKESTLLYVCFDGAAKCYNTNNVENIEDEVSMNRTERKNHAHQNLEMKREQVYLH